MTVIIVCVFNITNVTNVLHTFPHRLRFWKWFFSIEFNWSVDLTRNGTHTHTLFLYLSCKNPPRESPQPSLWPHLFKCWTRTNVPCYIHFLINFHLDFIYLFRFDSTWYFVECLCWLVSLQMRLWFLMCVSLTNVTIAMIVFYQF